MTIAQIDDMYTDAFTQYEELLRNNINHYKRIYSSNKVLMVRCMAMTRKMYNDVLTAAIYKRDMRIAAILKTRNDDVSLGSDEEVDTINFIVNDYVYNMAENAGMRSARHRVAENADANVMRSTDTELGPCNVPDNSASTLDDRAIHITNAYDTSMNIHSISASINFNTALGYEVADTVTIPIPVPINNTDANNVLTINSL